MRKALIVGINHYSNISSLYGCVNDAFKVRNVLERNSDGTVNFDVTLMTAERESEAIDRTSLRNRVEELFKGKSEIALVYFAGHGHVEATGGYLCTSECRHGHDGLSLGDLLQFANQSKAENRVVVLDSCHSGVAGGNPIQQQYAELSDGLTILTASTAEQYATEKNGSGIFTTLLVDALDGSAGDLVGNVTPGSVYAHIDQSLGAWQQRPVFKTNVTRFVSLRKVKPPIALADLQSLSVLFPTPGAEVQLDPTWEPEVTGRPINAPPPDEANTITFALLQRLNRVGLVVPNGASKPNMYHAAIESKTCKLTVLGQHYRRLAESRRI
jgi:hypothetical protein